MNFLPIIIGSDPNSYSAARSIHEAYQIKSVVVSSTVLIPFYRTSIAEIYQADYAIDNYIAKPDVLVDKLNEIYKKYAKENPDLKVLIYVPNEFYLQTIYDHLPSLNFDPYIPFAGPKLSKDLMYKENFYSYMDALNITYPKTVIVDKDNYKDLRIDGSLAMKADDNNAYKYAHEFNDKVFFVEGHKEAIHQLDQVFKTYPGKMIVQEYIHGGDGSEYSISGYRASDGSISMTQGRSILTDTRPSFIGNHIVIMDSDIEELYKISEKAIVGMDYHGFFNLDFKIDSKTNQIYILEINPRLARSFYYSNLAGVNYLELAIEDLIFNKPFVQEQTNKFNWVAASKKACGKELDGAFKDAYFEKERYENTAHSVIYDKDMKDLLRKLRLHKYLNDLDKMYFQ